MQEAVIANAARTPMLLALPLPSLRAKRSKLEGGANKKGPTKGPFEIYYLD
jgi:hypothetical protein